MAIVQNPIPIPEPINEVDALWRTTQALKETVEVMQGIRGNREYALLSDVDNIASTIVQNIISGGVVTTFADLTDTDVTGLLTNDMVFWDGADWIVTAGLLTWDGSTFNVGDPGTEATNILVNGASFDAVMKINEFGGSNDATLVLHRHAESAGVAANLIIARSRGNTSSHSNVVDNDYVGRLGFTAWHTSSYHRAGDIDVRIDGTPGNGDMPSEMVFATSEAGSNVPTEWMRLRPSGALQFPNAFVVDWENEATTPVELLEFTPQGVGGDPCWADVLYLAKWEGTDAATAYTELKQSDVQNFYGNAQLDTAQFNYGAASLLLDGTTDGVQSTGDTIFDLETEDEVTVDGFVRLNSLPAGAGTDWQLVNQAQQDVNSFEVRFGNLNGTLYQIEARFGFGNTPTGIIVAPTLDVWYYFAAQRRINGANHYVDIFFGLVSGGTASRVSQTLSNNNPSANVSGVPITVGAWDNTSNQTFTQVLDGHLDDIRLTRCARYGNVGSVTIPGDYPLIGQDPEEFHVGDPGYPTDIEGSEVLINGVPLVQNATHTGEVTGATALTVDVTAITNQTDVVADSADDVAIHDDTDGAIKKVNLSSITDAGYF